MGAGVRKKKGHHSIFCELKTKAECPPVLAKHYCPNFILHGLAMAFISNDVRLTLAIIVQYKIELFSEEKKMLLSVPFFVLEGLRWR